MKIASIVESQVSGVIFMIVIVQSPPPPSLMKLVLKFRAGGRRSQADNSFPWVGEGRQAAWKMQEGKKHLFPRLSYGTTACVIINKPLFSQLHFNYEVHCGFFFFSFVRVCTPAQSASLPGEEKVSTLC